MPDASSDAPINGPEKSTSERVNDLFESLRELGQALPVSLYPTSHDAPAISAGLIYYIATGSLEPPVVVTPDEAAERADLAEQTALNERDAEIAKLRRQLESRDAGPAAVAPAPVAEAPTPSAPAETGTIDPQTTTPVTPEGESPQS